VGRVRAIYEGGVFRPLEPVHLPESARPAHDRNDPTGWQAIDSLVGILDGTPPDVSENHDAYLHAKPRG